MGPVGANWCSDEFRSWGTWTGANSAHFNVDRAKTNPWSTVPASGNMHFGEHNPCKIRSTMHTRRRSELIPAANQCSGMDRHRMPALHVECDSDSEIDEGAASRL